ncbi:hypothetical protein [Mycolicibacterium sp.]|uniref:hypothetical protein n=1 Tax=Mycolicibacterium sp. TaxID=2320850 RepID=UPI0025F18999|nr:hypothetical protein [Mycolicibacterium sp.]MCB9408946.1 hypothetical protein [Mycolicibacterium sp.]
MGRRAATALHLTLILIGAVLYALFVLPRWWVLTGAMPPTLATVGRIATALPIGAAAAPVWLELQRSLRSNAATPELALRLRAWSGALHLIAGALILLAAITEIWLPLGVGGPYLFGVYGAAAAIAVLAVAAFYLSFVAEKPPAAPKPPKAQKPPKPKKEKKPKRPRGKKSDSAAEAGPSDSEAGAEPEGAEPDGAKPDGAETDSAEPDGAEPDGAEPDGAETDGAETDSAEPEGAEQDGAEPDREPEPTTASTDGTADGSADDTIVTDNAVDTDGEDAAETSEAAAISSVDATAEDQQAAGALRNRRPSGKIRQRLRR